MTASELEPRYDLSLLAMATTLLRSRRLVARWIAIGFILAASIVLLRPARYLASAAFIPQASDADRSGLASIAGQFGVRLPVGSQSLPPDFYVRLIRSRGVLGPIVRDTFVVPELGGARIAFFALYDIKDGPHPLREEEAVKRLRKLIRSSLSKSTGVVELSVVTAWPSVSFSIANALVTSVNDFNLRTRQSQASAERKFVEGRLTIAGADLREAEDRLERFLLSNRQYGGSPLLSFQRERLQRDVTLRQQLFTSLNQSYEEVRLREVRDTPVITVVESPTLPIQPLPRWRVQGILFGLAVGGMLGAVIAIVSATIRQRRNEADPEVNDFIMALEEAKVTLARTIPRAGNRLRHADREDT